MLISWAKTVIRPVVSWGRRVRNIYTLLTEYPSLKLGDNVFVQDCKFGKYNYLSSNSVLTKTTFGDFSYCGQNNRFKNVEIGAFTCIGPQVTIGLGRHPVDKFASLHPVFYSTAQQVGTTFVQHQCFEECSEKTIIGNDVWIGCGVIIPGGVRIGDGAIIATGAVVTKSVAPYSIVGGVPAKHIRYRFDEKTIADLLRVKWWEWSEEDLRNKATLFQNTTSLLKSLREGKMLKNE